MAIISWTQSKNSVSIKDSNISVKLTKDKHLGVYVGNRIKLRCPMGTTLAQAKRVAVKVYQDSMRPVADIVPEEATPLAHDVKVLEWDYEDHVAWMEAWPKSYVTDHGAIAIENGQITVLCGDASEDFLEALATNQA